MPRDGSNTSTGYIQVLWRGVSSQSQDPTAIYRLGVNIGEGSGEEILLGGKIFLEWS
jgi:hypothetical protein